MDISGNRLLLERKDFSYGVIERDHFKCVICGATNDLAAHHIIDRSLFEDGGYYLDNGVTVCPDDHLKAERTQISCKELRKKAGITNIILPEHFDTDEEWDHWGNIVMPTGARLRGELFFQDNVQKALSEGGVLGSFLPYVKYPRTYHLPWSPNLQNDDRMHKTVDQLFQLPLIGTIKMDGENTTLYPDYIHARSLDSKHHESRAWVKALHGRIAHEIPDGWRICGENMYAKHSILYTHLKDFFYVFSIWDETNTALSWKETLEYCEMLGLQTVPVFSTGITCQALIDNEFAAYTEDSPDDVEGYVLRFSERIPYHLFKSRTAKYVRSGHVQTSKFWMNEVVVPNVLEEGPRYNTDEMREILKILRSLEIESVSSVSVVDLITFIKDLGDNFDDSIRIKYKTINAINKLEEEEKRLGEWTNINTGATLTSLKAIYESIFCDFSKVPLNINGPLPGITSYRLKIGK